MPFPVACGCGQKFMAQDHLSGKEVPCPACGNPLLIQPPETAPSPKPAPAKTAAPKPATKPPAFQGAPPPAKPAASVGQIAVRCGCGKAYKAPAAMRGKALKCPACGQDVPIPLNAPLAGVAPVQAAPAVAPDPFGADPFAGAFLGNDPLGADLFNSPLAGGQLGAPLGGPLAMPMAGAAQPAHSYGAPQVADDGDGNNKLLIFLGIGVGVVLLGLFVGIWLVNRNKQPVVANNPAPATTPAATTTPATAPAVTTPSGAGANPMGPMSPMGPMGAGTANPMGMGPMGAGANPMGAGPMGATVPMPGFDPASTGGVVGTAPATAGAPADVGGNPMGPMGAGPMAPMGVGPMGVTGPGTPGSAGISTSSPSTPGTARTKGPGNSGSYGDGQGDDLPASRPSGKAFGEALVKWHPSGKLVGVRRVGEGDNLQGHYSWMTQILPFLGHQKIYDKFDFSKPRHDKANLQNGAYIIPEFLNPADDRKRWKGYPYENYALTHFAGMSGIEDARNVVAAKLPRSDPRAGIFGYDAVATPAEITDGTGNTIMILGAGELANPWVMGGGATIRGAREPYFDKISGFGFKGTSGVTVVMADGSVRVISSNISPAVFRALCTIHGAEKIDLATDAPLSTDK